MNSLSMLLLVAAFALAVIGTAMAHIRILGAAVIIGLACLAMVHGLR